MPMRRFMRHWWVAFRHGVGEGWFGWGAAAGLVVANFIVSAAQKGSIRALDPTSWWLTSWWFMLAATVLGGLAAVAIFNALVLAPYRACGMLKPFRIEVVSGQLDDEYPKGEFPPQSAAVVMKNKSYRQRSNCVLHVWQIAGFDNQHHALPRFIAEFSLLPGDTKQIKFLSWTTRSPPHGNDPMFMLHGPVGGGYYGGNVFTLPCGSHDIDIRIGVPEADAYVIRCRVWADGNNNLRAVRED
jgi:hypothetical protein